MAGPNTLHPISGIGTAYRTAIAVADNAVRATFETAEPTLIAISRMSELWLFGEFVGGSSADSAILVPYWYNAAGTFQDISLPITINATDRENAAGNFMAGVTVEINPGAERCRVAVRSITTGGTLSLFVGVRE